MKCVIFIDCNQGKVKWGLGEEDKEYGTAGKLDIPNFKDGEHESSLRNVGKLKLPANLEVTVFLFCQNIIEIIAFFMPIFIPY